MSRRKPQGPHQGPGVNHGGFDVLCGTAHMGRGSCALEAPPVPKLNRSVR